ncbi:MAG: 6-bladed beta-propeller [Gemmatimonadota bacterium]|jgi:hypothetical protein
MNTRQLIPVAFLFAAVAGCSDGDMGWAGTISDSAGVTIVSNPAQGIWAPGEEWVLEEELRIGGVEGDLDYLFGDIWGVTVDSHGRVFVLDFQEQRIQVYSPEGVYERTIGRRGEGPGEFMGGVSLLMGPGDTLLVQDNRLLRINRFAPDGSNAGSYRMQLDDRHPQAFKVTASGVIAEHFEYPDSPGQPAVENPTDAIAVVTTDGEILDTLLTYTSLASRGVYFYERGVSWDITDGPDLVSGDSDEYRLEIRSGDRLRRVVTKSSPSEPISEQEKASILGRCEEEAIESGAPADWVARRLESTHVADRVPAFRTIAFGPSSTLWVQRVRPVSELLNLEEPDVFDMTSRDFLDVGSRDWDVFNQEGRFLGTLLMPPRFTPHVFRGDKIYGVLRDELDVQYVVRFGIVGNLEDASL